MKDTRSPGLGGRSLTTRENDSLVQRRAYVYINRLDHVEYHLAQARLLAVHQVGLKTSQLICQFKQLSINTYLEETLGGLEALRANSNHASIWKCVAARRLKTRSVEKSAWYLTSLQAQWSLH